MTCIKTGADVFLPERGCTVHGDLFLIGETFILVCSDATETCYFYPPDGKHFIYHIRMSNYKRCGSRTIAATANDCGDFSYEGWSHK